MAKRDDVKASAERFLLDLPFRQRYDPKGVSADFLWRIAPLAKVVCTDADPHALVCTLHYSQRTSYAPLRPSGCSLLHDDY